MPAKSRKQQKWAYAVKGAAWARRHHFNKLRKTSRKRKRR
jgi:hypothetical protein